MLCLRAESALLPVLFELPETSCLLQRSREKPTVWLTSNPCSPKSCREGRSSFSSRATAFETLNGGQSVIVTSASGVSTAVNIPGAAYTPAIFSVATGRVVVRATDGMLISATNPAAAGDVLNVIATGLGQTTPALATGQITPRDQPFVTAPVTPQIGGVTANVSAATAIAGLAGVYQITVTCPLVWLPVPLNYSCRCRPPALHSSVVPTTQRPTLLIWP